MTDEDHLLTTMLVAFAIGVIGRSFEVGCVMAWTQFMYGKIILGIGEQERRGR